MQSGWRKRRQTFLTYLRDRASGSSFDRMIQLKTANNFITHCLDDVADVLKGREKLDLKNTIDDLADRMEEHQNHMGFLLEANLVPLAFYICEYNCGEHAPIGKGVWHFQPPRSPSPE